MRTPHCWKQRSRNCLKLKNVNDMEPINVKDKQEWRFWSIVCLSFLYPLNNAIINLAIPLYYFKQSVPIQIIGGILVASITMTYCFSPILFRKYSDKIGRKKSVCIAMIGTSFAQMIFYFTLEPLIFIISRLIEGFVTGLYWSNLQASISENVKNDPDKYIARFNFGWNSGVLSGFLLGALILFNTNDLRIIFYFAPLLIFLSLIIAIIFFREINPNIWKKIESSEYDNIFNSNLKEESYNISKFYIPIILPVLLIIAFAFQQASVFLLYSIKSEILGFETYTVYLLAFFYIFLSSFPHQYQVIYL